MKMLLPNGEIAEPQAGFAIPLFRLAFRPFFLFGAFFSVFSLLVWAGLFNGLWQFNVYGGSYWWHIHEMLFGFVGLIISGFLLTAVQNWTQHPSVNGVSLIFLFVLWFTGRILMLVPDIVPDWLIIIVDIAFLPCCAVFLARPLIKVRQWRNIMFVPILLVMALVNSLMHAAASIQSMTNLQQASLTMVLLVTLVMCIIGGRVFPMFTANGTQTDRVPPINWLEKLSLFSVVAAIVVSVNLIAITAELKATIYLVAGLANFARALRWRIWVTWKTPLVWSLHLSYWSMALGLVLLAVAELTTIVTQSQAIHAVTVGGMGGMILAMISRVSLGHTGRPLAVSKVMALAFGLLFIALLVRVLGSLIIDNYLTVISISALAWSVGYLIFVVVYTPILTSPRVDGRDG